MPDSCGGPLAKMPHLEVMIESYQDSKMSSGHVSGSAATSRKKRSHGGCIPDMLESTILSTPCTSIVLVGTLPK